MKYVVIEVENVGRGAITISEIWTSTVVNITMGVVPDTAPGTLARKKIKLDFEGPTLPLRLDGQAAATWSAPVEPLEYHLSRDLRVDDQLLVHIKAGGRLLVRPIVRPEITVAWHRWNTDAITGKTDDPEAAQE